VLKGGTDVTGKGEAERGTDYTRQHRQRSMHAVKKRCEKLDPRRSGGQQAATATPGCVCCVRGRITDDVVMRDDAR
jgi:hypothetical protein